MAVDTVLTKTEVKHRTVSKVSPSLKTLEGGGVEIHRAFPTPQLEDLDPFLLLDHMGPIQFEPGKGTGFPDHPHRGFETVTYLLQGEMDHRDSFGNRGSLTPGDVQWMTAGSGLVHSEMPGRELIRDGGRLEGFQLWVNLPRRDKMVAPRYQELKAHEIPDVDKDGVRVKVIAGESLGTRGVIESRTPILYLHVTLAPGAQLVQRVPKNFNAFAYVIGGAVRFEGRQDVQSDDTLVLFSNDHDHVVVSNPGDEAADLLLIAGEPIGEPIARYGPFVMNTRDELVQAFEDFRNGKMGRI
jgi:quercetin 2,3-dioxygenase